jgi:phospholipid/cholesterol/gamma-HCH transport system permease protein
LDYATVPPAVALHPQPVTAVDSHRAASLDSSRAEDGALTLTLGGWLDAHTIPGHWKRARALLRDQKPPSVTVDASRLDYCDGAGIAMMVDLQRRQMAAGGTLEIRGLPERYQSLLELFKPEEFQEVARAKPVPACFPEEVGRNSAIILKDIRALLGFIGELSAALVFAVRHPRSVRWRDALLVAENAGANAIGIVALISFLIGLIMAFQSAIPMRQFGVELFVADLVALSMFRELGPLMTAIIVAGRSGSAFAAELGTMKVNEEINALNTMGLDPVRFLVTTRVIASVAMMPLLTMISNLMGLLGGAVVLMSMNYPFVTYLHQVRGALDLEDLLGGLAKSLVFAVLVAGIGCLRGLQTKTGASAVGISTTRAVVSGIILIVLADGAFSVAFYYLGI